MSIKVQTELEVDRRKVQNVFSCIKNDGTLFALPSKETCTVVLQRNTETSSYYLD